MRKIYKRIFLIFILSAIIATNAYSTHFVGGSLTYEYLGSDNYTVTFKMYRDCCPTCTAFPNTVAVNIRRADGVNYTPATVTLATISTSAVGAVLPPCASAPSTTPCVQERIYRANVTLPPSPGGLHLYYSDCCRNTTISNILNPGGAGETFYAFIPGYSNQWVEGFVLANGLTSDAGATAWTRTLGLTPPTTAQVNNGVFEVTGADAVNRWLEDFTLTNGTTTDAGATAWTQTPGATPPTSSQVNANLFEVIGANNGSMTWSSQVINISAYTSGINLSADLSEAGQMDAGDNISISYSINGGAPVLFPVNGSISDDFTNAVATASGLIGNTVQIFISTQSDGTSPTSEIYRFDNVAVSSNASATWTSQVINISGYTTGVNLSVNTTRLGTMEAGDSLKIYYSLNGGPLTLFTTNGQLLGNYASPATATTTGLSGSTIQIVIKATFNAASPNTEIYQWDMVSVYSTFLTNSSAVFGTPPPLYLCAVNPFTINYSATDSDGDSLSYSMITPYNDVPTPTFPENTATFTPVTWTASYSANSPFNSGGPGVTLNPTTGMMTGSANSLGQYVFGVKCAEYRNGVLINFIVRDYQANVITCPPFVPTTPTAGTTNPSPICAGQTLNLTASSPDAGVTYLWTGPNGFTSTLQNPSIPSATVAASGTYSVTATVSGCQSSAGTITIVVNPIPAAPAASSNTPVCAGTTLNLTATTVAGATYSWTGPNSFSSTTQNPSISGITVAGAGTYSVTAIVSGCPSAFGTTNVVVNPTPVAPTAGSNSPVCIAATLNLTAATIAGATYSWTGPNGFSSTTQNPSITGITAAGSGTYSVTATVGGCTSAFGTTAVVVNPTPSAPTAGSNSPVCVTSTLNLTASTIAGATYSWTGPNTFSSTTQNPSIAGITLAGSGTYSVTATAGGCTSAFGTVAVVVNPTPAAPTAAGATICTGTSTTLTATAPGGTYAWYDAASGGTLLFTGASYTTPALTTTTTYYVQTTIAGCTGPRTAVTVTVNPLPAAPTAAGATICTGTSTTLTATAPGGTYAWYDAASGGTLLFTGASYTTPVLSANTTYYVQTTIAGCAGPRTAVTVTVSPVPAAPTAAGATICISTSTTLTATAPGGTYTWYDAASGGTLLFTGASYTTPVLSANTTYYVQTTIAGCAGPRTAVTVTVSPVPAAPTAAGATICTGTSTTLTVTAPGGTYEWYNAASGGTLLFTGASYTTPVLSANTTYYVQTTIAGCAGPRTAVSVTVSPVPAAPTAAGATICISTSTTLTATAPGGTYTWYDAASGGTLLFTGASYTTPVLSANTTYYVQTTIAGCAGPRTAVSVTVSPVPAAPTAAGATICTGTSTTLTATAPGGTYTWYNAASGGTLLFTGASYTTPVLSANITYYVQTTIAGCAGPRTAVTVTVSPVPAAPTAAGATICSGTSATLTATAPGGTYDWYNASSGGTLLSTGATYTTPVLTSNTTYYVQTTIAGCAGPRTAVLVTVNPIPAAPTAAGTTICQGTTATLNATAPGGTYEWYDAASGGTLLVTSANYTTPVLSATTTYYVQTTIAGCTGPRTAVTVTVTPTPAAPTAAGTTICQGTTATLNATAPGGTYQWYDAASGGTLLATAASYTTPSLSINTTYYVQTTIAGCTGPRTAVTVTVTPTPAAPTASGITICSGSTATLNATAPGGNYEWYSAATGGTLLIANASYTTPTLTTTTTYYVQTTISGCTSPRTAVVVTVNPIPAAPTAANTTICNGSTATITATAPGGSYQWYDAASGGTLLASAASYTTPALTLTTTYYVQTTIGGCTGPRTAVTVVVNPIPAAPTAAGVTICSGNSTTLSATAPGGTYRWFSVPTGGVALFTGANFTTPVLTVTTTYYVQTTVGGCTSTRTPVTVTVTPTPAAPTASGTTICSGSTTTLTATAPGGIYEWYDAASGGTLLASTASYTTSALTSTTTYYVQSTIAGCVGPRTAVTVTITPIDDPTFNYASGTYCITGTNPTPTITGMTGTFSATPAGLVFTNTTTGTINLGASTLNTYTVTYTTNGSCPASSTANITITNAPNAAFSYNTPFCQNDANALPVFGPGASAGIFSAPSGLVFVSTSTGEIDLSSSTPGTYTITNNIAAAGGCAAAMATTSVTINIAPQVNAGSPQTICAGTTATMGGTIGGTATSVTWSGGTGSFSNSSSLTAIYTPGVGETTATLILTTNDPAGPCSAIADTVVISITPTPATPTASGATICAGNTATLTATAPGGTYQWYDAVSGGTLLFTGASYTTPVLSSTITYYVQTTISSCQGPRTAVTVTVNPIPASPTAAGSTICAGNTTTLTATAPGGTYEWFDASTGGTLLATNSNYTTPTLSSTTTYYVQTTISGCVSPRTAVTVTVNPIPAAPTASNITICDGSTGTITATAPGGIYQWYDAASGGTLLASTANYTTPPLTSTTTYYVQTTIGGCTGPRTAVTVNVNPIPVAPTATGTTICQGTTTTLSATAPGGTYRWYPVPTGGTVLFTGANYTTPVLNVTTNYYVQTTVGGCTSPRTIVTVTVTPTPAPPTASGASICEGNTTTLTATAPGGSYEWYNAASGGILLTTNANFTTPALTTTTNYYVQTTVGGCTGPRTTVTVTVNPIDNSSFSYSSGTYCFTGTNPTPTITGTTGTFSSSPAGLTFVNTSTGEINLSASALNTYSITYTTGGICSSSTTVNVTITNAPSAVFSYSTPYCQNDNNPLPLFSIGASAGTFSSVPSGLTFVNPSTGEIDLALTAVGTYTITNDIAAAGGCAAATATSTITINPTATVNAGTDKLICGSGTTILSGSIGGSAISGSWSGGTGTFSNPNSLTPVYTPGTGETSAMLILTTNDPAGPCDAVSDTMIVTINPIPVSPTVLGVTICEGTTGTLTATAPGGTYNWFSVPTGGTSLITGASYTSPILTTSTTYYVQTTVGGCAGPRTGAAITVTPTENASFSYSSGTFCVTGTNPTPTVASGVTGTFSSTPAGLSFINATTGEINLAASALNTYTITFTTDGTCPGSSSVTVTITSAPSATFTYGAAYCPSGVDPFPTFPSGSSPGIFSAVPAGLTFINVTTGQIDLSASAPGTYTVTNNIAAAGGCAAATATSSVTIDLLPTVTAGTDQLICSGAAVNLNGALGGSATSAMWTGGTGSFSLSSDPSAIYTPGIGETSVTLVLTTNDPAGSCGAVNDSVTINFQIDTSTFSYSSGTFCSSGTNPTPVVTGGYTGTFSATPAGLVFVNTTTGEINLSASTLNTYSITFTSNGTCPNSSSVNVTITNGFDATFAYAGPYCQSETNPLPSFNPGASAGVFSATPSGLNFMNTSTGEIDFATTLPGTYLITNNIAASGGCAAASASATIVIDPAAIVNAGINRSICVGSTVTLAGSISGSATGATWSGGLGSFSSPTALNAVYTPAVGETSVLLILTSNDPAGPCGSDTDSMTITINPIPTAPVVTDTSICSGSSATLVATAPGGTYSWYDMPGGTLLLTNVSYTTPLLTSTTTYYVETSVAGCTSPQTMVTVTVNPAAISNAGSDQTVCSNNAAVTLLGTITNANGGTWTTTGTGTFSPNDTSLNAVYMPGVSEIAAGNVTLVLTTNGTCAVAIDSMTITFSPSPVVNAGTDQFICTGTTSASLNGSVSGGASTGQWTTLGSGTFSVNDTTLNATYLLSASDTAAGSVMLILTSTNNANCVAVADTMTISITTIPVTSAGNDTTVCGNNPSLVLNGAITGGSGMGIWSSNGSGTFAPSDSVLNATYTPDATDITNGNVVLTLTPFNSCLTIADSITVTITPPTIVNAGADMNVCSSVPSVTLAGSITGSSTTGTWITNGDGTFSPSADSLNTIYTFGTTDTTSGNVMLILTSSNNGNCAAIADTMLINIITNPIVYAGIDTTVCGNNPSIQLSGFISPGQAIWTSSGTGSFVPNDSLVNATYIPDAADIANGTVTLTLTPINPCTPIADSIVLTITPPTFVNAGNDTVVCTSLTGLVLNGSILGGTTTGTWTTTGNGTFGPSNDSLNSTYTFGSSDITAGNVMLILSSSNNGICNSIIDTMLVTIANSITAYAGNDTTTCANVDMTLNGTLTGGTTAQWTTSGSGSFAPSDTSINVTYVASAADISAGSVIIILTPTNSCLTLSDSLVLTFTAPPVVNAGPDTTLCSIAGGIALAGTINGATGGYWSSNGSGSFLPNDSVLNATYVPGMTDGDTITFVLTSFGNGSCNPVNDTMVLFQNVKPVADFTATLACSGQTVTFNDSSTITGGTITGWSWNFGTDTSSVQNPTTTFATAGTVTVSLVITSGTGCTDTVSQLITVNPIPTASFTSVAGCMNQAVAFSNSSSSDVVSWNWNFGDGNSSVLSDPINLYDSAATYSVVLVVTSDSGCTATTSQQVTIHPMPTAGFIASVNCTSLAVAFTDTTSISSGTITNYNWSFGDGGTSLLQHPNYTYSSEGTYTVTLIVQSDNGCLDTSVTTITTGTPVFADYIPAGGNYSVNQSIAFTNQSTGAVSYLWDFGDGTTPSTSSDPTYAFSAPGSYTVILISTNSGGCSDSVSYEFNINSSATAVPTGFTPDGDGLNDFFYVLGNFSQYELRVFNEWGNQIFISVNQSDKWDGTYKGAKQPGGPYIYIFNGTSIDGSEVKLNGEITLVR